MRRFVHHSVLSVLLLPVLACDESSREDTGVRSADSGGPSMREQPPDVHPTEGPNPSEMQSSMPGGQTGGGCQSAWSVCGYDWQELDAGPAEETCRARWEQELLRLRHREPWSFESSSCIEVMTDSGSVPWCSCSYGRASGGIDIVNTCDCSFLSAGGRCLLTQYRAGLQCDPSIPDDCAERCETLADLHNATVGLEVELLATTCELRGCRAWIREGDACYVVDRAAYAELRLPCDTPPAVAFERYAQGKEQADQDGGL